MAKPETAKTGCFSGFLRVLLCAGTGTSPPVHPSDHVSEPDETELVHMHSNKDAIVEDTAATPGLVARLMGLDSLPNTNLAVKGATPDSVPRSRSVNFVDYLLKFDLGQANNHGQVKTSASFREVPALVNRQQEHDHVVLYWDGNVSKEHEARFDLRKLEMGLEEWKQGKEQGSKSKEVVRERVGVKKERNQGKNKKISKLKNEPRRVPSSKHSKKVQKQSEAKDLSSVSSSSKSCSYRYSGDGGSSSSSSSPFPNKQKKEFVESSLTKKIRKQKSPEKIEKDYNSENLSPVSVLDIKDCPSLYGTNFLDSTSPLASKSKWKSSSLISLSDGVEDRGGINKGCACANSNINREAEYYSELMLKLHTLTERDIRELDCTTKRMYEYEDFDEICLLFEHKILDLLLHEVVNEVVELSR